MNINRKLKELHEDFEFYKKNLLNKKYMFIYSELTNKQLSKIIKNPKIKNLKIPLEKLSVIFLSSPKWHPGVIGVVSSRLAIKFNIPVV